MDWTVHDTRYVHLQISSDSFESIKFSFVCIQFLPRMTWLEKRQGFDADRKPFKNRNGRYGYRRNRPQGVARSQQKQPRAFTRAFPLGMQIPFPDPWQHATQLEFTFKFPAARLHTVFFPFRIVNFHSALVRSKGKKKGKKGDRRFGGDFVRLITKFDIALHRSVSVLRSDKGDFIWIDDLI